MFQASVGYLRVFKPQQVEVTQPFEVFQANIRDLGIIEPQVAKLAKRFKVLQVSVGHCGVLEIHTQDAFKEIIAKKFSQPSWPWL